MIKIYFLLIIVCSLISCSSKKNIAGINLDNIDTTPIEQVTSAKVINLETSALLNVNDLDVTASSIFDDSPKHTIASTDVTSNATLDEIVLYDVKGGTIIKPSELDRNIPETVRYKVKKDETLMLIAHKLYGRYQRWKDIEKVNGELLITTKVEAGVSILVPTPDDKFSNVHKGTPYILQAGDTLRTVSKHAYQTPIYWEYIWNNNRDSIEDPNIIFAGFTVFYLPLKDGMITSGK
ncbi:MAG: LysM peptidoglycan-binding domain-containing protein [Bacteriovoracaceae bacterium]|jgi:nucleoid-associated protein YgaU|nr:LysM peptidoglycan-binding domain-containing protein [Bacteriovoracaceae bacterium]